MRKVLIEICYSFVMYLLCAVMHIAALFHKKAKQWIDGRKNWRQNLKQQTAEFQQKSIWVHCSSLGEFEQARPVIEGLKLKYPENPILLSFFSPSGYNIRKNYAGADMVTYLPCDIPGNADYFVQCINPALVIFVKYDLWLNYFKTIKSNNIPLLIISVLQDQKLGHSFGDIYKKYCFSFADKIFVQNQDTYINVQDKVKTKVVLAGDTRVDSVAKNALIIDKMLENRISRFIVNSNCLICGSTWPADNDLLIDLLKEDVFEGWKAIIAPHEMHASEFKKLEAAFGENMFYYSDFENSDKTKQILIINSIGFLSKLYRYGTIAYIGGGFGKAIHNTLEPAAFGLPVIFGPKYQKFMEANTLVNQQAFISINNKNQLKEAFIYFKNNENRQTASEKIKQYIVKHQGGSAIILDDIETNWMKPHINI